MVFCLNLFFAFIGCAGKMRNLAQHAYQANKALASHPCMRTKLEASKRTHSQVSGEKATRSGEANQPNIFRQNSAAPLVAYVSAVLSRRVSARVASQIPTQTTCIVEQTDNWIQGVAIQYFQCETKQRRCCPSPMHELLILP